MWLLAEQLQVKCRVSLAVLGHPKPGFFVPACFGKHPLLIIRRLD